MKSKKIILITSLVAVVAIALGIALSTASKKSEASTTSWNFKDSSFKSLGTISSSITVDNLGLIATSSKTLQVKSNSKTLNGTTYSHCLALGGSGSTSYRAIKVPVSGISTINVVLASSSSSSVRTLVVADANGNQLGSLEAGKTISEQSYNYTGNSGYIYLYSKSSGINVYKVSVVTGTSATATVKATIAAATATAKATSSTSSSTKTAAQIVSDMKVGWNLGNTLDSTASWLNINSASATDYEKAWGNPATTKAMITAIKKQGFNTVRIPVSWGEKMSSDYTVNSAWMNRVQEVVDYAIDNGMYVILNAHHEGSWLYPSNAYVSSATPKLESLWKQIATRFKNYDQHLIFEVMNEPRLEGTSYEWTSGNSEAWSVINKYNKTAVNAIRGVGGNNSTRALMIPTYAASPSAEAINALEVPNNDKMIILSVHGYSPYYFSMVVGETASWGTSSEKSDIDNLLNTVKNCAASKGIPVVIGEFGTINKNNTDARATHAAYYVKAAKQRGITCVWWDNNAFTANTSETYGIFERSSLTWKFQSIANALVNNAN